MDPNKLVFRLLFLLLLTGSQVLLWGQSKRAYERAGDLAYQKKDYSSAFEYYGKVIEKAPNDLGAHLKFAESALQFAAYDIAERAYKVVLSKEKGNQKYPLAFLQLAIIAQTKGQYATAIELANSYLQHPSRDTVWIEKAHRLLSSCEWAINAQGEKPKAQIQHLDKKINSPFSDFSPVVRGDTLYFSSYRFEKTDRKTRNKTRNTRLMSSINGRAAREPLRGIPSGDSAHIAHPAFTPDGLFLIYTLCKNTSPSEIRCELWMINKDRKGRWTKPRRLPEPINLPGYTTSQPSISLDKDTNALTLWFASDRPGGKGKMDIWSVPLNSDWFCPCNLPIEARKPQKLPYFEAPQPVEAINTSENEWSPFYHSATETLYFSSEGHTGFGGQDIFQIHYPSGEKYGTIENLGTGINTSYNDSYFFLNEKGTSGYLSSNRPGSLYLDERNKACCNDLFFLEMSKDAPNEQELNPQKEGPPTDPELATSKQLQPENPTGQTGQWAEFKGLPLFFDNDEPDKRTRKTTTKKSYETTVLLYLEREQEYLQRYSAGLRETEAESAQQAITEFFQEEVRTGYEQLNQLCALLAQRLAAKDTVEVFIKGFTSPRAESDYNLNLGKRRISSVRNHLFEWSDGILAPYLNAGQLKVTEVSFGETTAKAGLSDDLKDERNSIYAPEAARERRVEIVEITSSTQQK
ncbi:MAG: hypothetical protein ACK5SQ_01635 [Chitinophagales bacterium]|jgi:outer membrane protein OmpA-like peptidoglycan-associated protein